MKLLSPPSLPGCALWKKITPEAWGVTVTLLEGMGLAYLLCRSLAWDLSLLPHLLIPSVICISLDSCVYAYVFLLWVTIHYHFIYFVALGDIVNVQNTFKPDMIHSKSGSCLAWIRAAGSQPR